MDGKYLFGEPLEIGFTYDVTFGMGEGSEEYDWSVTATPEEERAIYEAYMDEVGSDYLPDSYPVLWSAYNRAYAEIKKEETRNALEMGDSYAEECEEEGLSPFDCGWSLNVMFCEPENYISLENALKYADEHDRHWFYTEHCEKKLKLTEKVTVEYCFTAQDSRHATDPKRMEIRVTAEEARLYEEGRTQGLKLAEIEGLQAMLKRAKHRIFCDADLDPEEQPNVSLDISFPREETVSGVS